MFKGQGFDAIAGDLGILMLFALLFTLANILGLRKYRKV
jgi:ABC-2 type transport system permease protein